MIISVLFFIAVACHLTGGHIEKNTGISVGNIIGSNIFNLLFVLGCGSLVRPIPLPICNIHTNRVKLP